MTISDWGAETTLRYFGRQSTRSIPEADPLYRQVYDQTAKDPRTQPSLDGLDILLLDPWGHGPLNRLFGSAESLERPADFNSIVRLAQRQRGLRCTRIARRTKELYWCAKT